MYSGSVLQDNSCGNTGKLVFHSGETEFPPTTEILHLTRRNEPMPGKDTHFRLFTVVISFIRVKTNFSLRINREQNKEHAFTAVLKLLK